MLVQTPLYITIHRFRLFPFRSPLLGKSIFFLLLQVLRCFSSLRLLFFRSAWASLTRVAPFGYVRIISCWQIPAPFRSFPRPSSPPEAKASSVRPCNFSRYEFLFVSFEIVVPISYFIYRLSFLFSLPRYLSHHFNELTVFLKRDCKDTDFFFTSKFLLKKIAFFWDNFLCYFLTYSYSVCSQINFFQLILR